MLKTPKVILLIESSRAFGRSLLRGIAKYSRLNGPWSFYRERPVYSEPLYGTKMNISRLKKWGANGIIAYKPINLEIILSLNLPTILARGYREKLPQNISCIIPDNHADGIMAAEYFLNRGYRYFAYCGYDAMFSSVDRGISFCNRIAEANFEVHVYEQPKSKAHRSWEYEQTSIADWLKSLPRPLALLACNDERGQEVIEACGIAGLHVPEEVSILGVNNDNLVCELCNPSLSSIERNTFSAGYEAANLLSRLMAGEKIDNQTIVVRPQSIVTRQSTDILAIDDRLVADAIGYIRNHARTIINVQDVIDHVSSSRRVLQQRFRKVIGRSIHDEIVRFRMEQVARMLLQTNLSLSQIAIKMGYPDVKHISRSFRVVFGLSAHDYRKLHLK